MITIYHNPRCSKSREALSLVEQIASQRGLPLDVVEYLKTPLTADQLAALQHQLGADARAMVRDNEPEYAELSLEKADDAALIEAIAHHPKLLQRPIVVYQGRARIGRPPECLKEFLQPAGAGE